ncbi:MAG TPA: hypothetical protein VFR30_10635, partial [Lysobacter sp.]|nr:hypothetical protein [Lysobacter sp.]
MIKIGFSALALACLLPATVEAAPGGRQVGVNVLLNTEPSAAILAELASYGAVRGVLAEIDAVTLRTTEGGLAAIRALPYVIAANPDAVRNGRPVDTVAANSFVNGISTWDQDAVDVTDKVAPGNPPRTGLAALFDGAGVYVAVLDTGLLDTWRQYFPQERIASQF